MNTIYTAYAILGLLATSLADPSVSEDVEERIDDFVNEVMECSGLLGMSLGVVRDGQPFIAKGYGMKDMSSNEEVTGTTLFNIASITKHFASILIGMVLEDYEEYSYDTPIQTILQDFHVSDPYRSSKINFRDCLSHRTGGSRNDELRANNLTAQEFVQRMRHLELPLEFRDQMNYMNNFYGVSTYAVEALTGETWEEMLASRVLEPLGMDDTTFLKLSEDRWDEYAKGHILDNGVLRELSIETAKIYAEPFTAPGGLATNAVDMNKWMLALINKGKDEEGNQVISEDVLENVQMPTTVSISSESIREPTFPVAFSLQKYGLGMYSGLYRGFELRGHGGSMAGVLSRMTFMPDAEHGIFISVNSPDGPDGKIRLYLTMFIYDLLLGLEPWVTVDDLCTMVQEEIKSSHEPQGSIDETVDQLPKHMKDIVAANKSPMKVDDYTGTFGNYAYGNVSFYIDESGHLFMSYGPYAIWDLGDGGIGDVFHGTGTDIFWWNSRLITFSRNDDTDEVNEVIIDFDAMAPPTFYRDLDWDNVPPPPQLCPDDD